MQEKQRRIALAIILAHAIMVVIHATSHIAEEIALPTAANAFVFVVIFLGPFVALALLYSHHPLAGAWLLVVAMLGSFVFGMVNHLWLPGPDNLAQVGEEPWGIVFRVSALLLAALEAGGTLLGAWMVQSLGKRD